MPAWMPRLPVRRVVLTQRPVAVEGDRGGEGAFFFLGVGGQPGRLVPGPGRVTLEEVSRIRFRGGEFVGGGHERPVAAQRHRTSEEEAGQAIVRDEPGDLVPVIGVGVAFEEVGRPGVRITGVLAAGAHERPVAVNRDGHAEKVTAGRVGMRQFVDLGVGRRGCADHHRGHQHHQPCRSMCDIVHNRSCFLSIQAG